GPSTFFFFLKSSGGSLILRPRKISHSCEAWKSDEYSPAIKPTIKEIEKPLIDSASKIKKIITAINVVIVVFKLRVNDLTTLLLTTDAKRLYDVIRFSNRIFSLIRSKITIVLLIV